MKTTVQLGMLSVLVEASDYQALVREAWTIYRLNQAVHQEGIPLEECMPYAETGADGNEYCGFVHVPTGRRIRLGKQKEGTGGDWFPRAKGSEHYKGLETWSAGDPSRQLPEHNERPQVGGKASGRPAQQKPEPPPAGGDGAAQDATPPYADWFAMVDKKLRAKSKADIWVWNEARGEVEEKVSGWPERWKTKVHDLITELAPTGDDLPF